MSLLEQWLNTFGGGAPVVSDLVPAAQTIPVPEATTVPKAPIVPKAPVVNQIPFDFDVPKLSTGSQIPLDFNEPPAKPAVNPTVKPAVNSIPAGQQVGSVDNPSYKNNWGNKHNWGYKPDWTFRSPDAMRPKFTFNPGTITGPPAVALEALLHSENLNTDEFGGEAGEAWLAENRPEGWTSSTMEVEEQVTSNES